MSNKARIRIQNLIAVLRQRWVTRGEVRAITGNEMIRPKKIIKEGGERVIRTGPKGSVLSAGEPHTEMWRLVEAPIETVCHECERIERLFNGQIPLYRAYEMEIHMRARGGDKIAQNWLNQRDGSDDE